MSPVWINSNDRNNHTGHVHLTTPQANEGIAPDFPNPLSHRPARNQFSTVGWAAKPNT